MATIINSSTSNGLVMTPDTSGEIELQANGVTKAKVTANGLQDANGNSLRGGSFRNRIINGNMVIDQRNNGSSATANTNAYFVDRLQLQASGTPPVLTGQRVTDAPNDFKYSMKFTTNATTDTLIAAEAVTPRQNIEGFNVADFNFGNANAKEFTVSFWVKGSVTGIYGFCVMNGSFNRHYVTTYNINSANTWEKKTITLTADTSGTWDTTSGVGVRIMFPLDTGPDMETATTETWGAGDKRRTSSCVKLLQSSSATWQVTGLQVELGSGASDFEFLPYDVQLARCQRYYVKWLVPVNTGGGATTWATAVNTTIADGVIFLPTTMRTGSLSLTVNSLQYYISTTSGTGSSGTWSLAYTTNDKVKVIRYTHGSGVFTAGTAIAFAGNGTSGYLALDGEL